jgi:hypothetical protein
LNTIVNEAKQAAREAAEKFFQEKLGGVDQYSCGFAWVDIFGIKGNTRLGKAFKAAGIRKSYTGSIPNLESGGNGVCRTLTLLKPVPKQPLGFLRNTVLKPMLDRG